MSKKILRNIQLHELMDLKIDYAFKQLFGTEKNKQLTIVFLNAILRKTRRSPIEDVIFIAQEVGGEYKEDKQSRLDIVVRNEANELINIEMQLANQNDMIQRTLYYWSRLYASQLKRSKGYHLLHPTITINICDFDLLPTPNYHSSYYLCEHDTKHPLFQNNHIFEIHFIEMKKFIKLWYEHQLNPFDDLLVRWLLLLSMVDDRKSKVYDDIYKELEELTMTDSRLEQAFQKWEELSQTPESILAYDARLKAILDEEARIEYAETKGFEKGKDKGFKQGKDNGLRQAAQSILDQGYSMQEVSKLLNLPVEKIQKLIEKEPS
ncbi:Rpn family recombination-promoting nuclease/putative transposase [Savagea faecisuis]|uniref:Rpn family recombination-promoting nuclease/putative transposase n=1 Tax=Savagea faecisuis TaxID=1274803 RepID=A0ABW3H122_9BACL